MSGAQINGGGIGFAGALTILFIGLKLAGYITWSWLWVMSPIWISLCAVVLVIMVLLIIAALSR